MASLFAKLFKTKDDSANAKRADRVVGVDIGKTSIKVVEIAERDGVLTLTTYGEIQIGPYCNEPIGQSNTLSASQEQSAVVDLFRESAVQASQAVFIVPLSNSFVTVMQLPRIDGESDVSARVQVDARKYIPIPIKDVTLDWAEINAEHADKDVQEVLLAAIQNESLERTHELMRKTNLPKQPTEIECFSVIRAAASVEQETVAILDIGGGSMKLYVVHQGLLQQIHRIQIGGSTATQNIADALQIGFADAELEKRSVASGAKHADAVIQAHRQTFQKPLQEYKQFLAEYETTHNVTIDTVVVTGGSCLFAGMLDQVGEVLDRPVTSAQPFTKVAYPAFMEDVVTEIAPTYTGALGAAMRLFE